MGENLGQVKMVKGKTKVGTRQRKFDSWYQLNGLKK